MVNRLIAFPIALFVITPAFLLHGVAAATRSKKLNAGSDRILNLLRPAQWY